MASYTEDTLDKLSKKNVIEIALALQDKVESGNTEILEEIRKLNDNFKNIEGELIVSKKVNSELQKHIIQLEKQCWANAQYSRSECLELVGIPSSIEQDQLEDKVVEIFNKVRCNIVKENVEACHRIGKKNDRVIIKFSKLKECLQVLSVKKDLKNLDMVDIGLPENCKVFVNQSLCSYYKLKNYIPWGKYIIFFISNDTIKIKRSEGSSSLAITHDSDFEKYFRGIDLSPP